MDRLVLAGAIPGRAGADIGSSTMKAALVHRDRGVIAISEQTYPMHRPHLGRAENDPMDWYRALSQAVPTVLAAARVSAGEVAAVCVVSQRDIAVLIGPLINELANGPL